MATLRTPTVTQRLQAAEALCRASGARFTPMRREVYAHMLAAAAPLSAYDLLDGLKRRLGKPLAPPTVYRALEFLLEQGLIHRVESTHAYLTCVHPGEAHQSLYLVCTECGTTEELDDHQIGGLLQQRARKSHFKPRKQVVELQGTCEKCS
jgi:Fur family transcriptional regulator, zinc uptake regulator